VRTTGGRLSRYFLAIGILALAVGLFGCGAKTSALVGTWSNDSGVWTLTFYKDGTVHELRQSGGGVDTMGTYSVTSSQDAPAIVLTFKDDGLYSDTWSYRVEGDRLHLALPKKDLPEVVLNRFPTEQAAVDHFKRVVKQAEPPAAMTVADSREAVLLMNEYYKGLSEAGAKGDSGNWAGLGKKTGEDTQVLRSAEKAARWLNGFSFSSSKTTGTGIEFQIKCTYDYGGQNSNAFGSSRIDTWRFGKLESGGFRLVSFSRGEYRR
jgi:hypothetical protein